MTLQLHNTLTKKTEPFVPMAKNKAALYTCGPTIYDYLHVGNWSALIYADTLVRTLIADGYVVDRVMNITDVGHLVSDADEGEDKIAKGAKREGKTAWEIADFYTDDFIAGTKKLGLLPPQHLVRATNFIPQQLELVRTLKNKGYTYQIDDGIYFDTSLFPTYANFAGLDLAAQKAGARVHFNTQKRNPSDFALWKFTPTDEVRDMEWETPKDLLDSDRGSAEVHSGDGFAGAPLELSTAVDVSMNKPQQNHSPAVSASSHPGLASDKHLQPEPEPASKPGSSPERSRLSEAKAEVTNKAETANKIMGFPGWHLECSAMAMSILGSTIDIHTGGIDHIPVHHTNEIAQSEAASGQQFAHFWVHNNHIKADGTKISKSLGNGYTLQDLRERGFDPLDYRMFVLQGHYSNEGNFTFDNLTAAKNRRHHWRNIAALRHQTHDTITNDAEKLDAGKFLPLLATSGAVREALNNNLNTPEALRIVDEIFSRVENKPLAAVHQHGLIQLLETLDELLGLQLLDTTPDIDDEAKQIILKRNHARVEKDWQASDELRKQLTERGITIRDTASGSIWEYSA